MYTVPSSIARSVETWIAVPRTVPVTHLLPSKRDDEGRMVTHPSHSSNEKDVIERLLLQNCSVLTIGQRCADWFLLRQFRVTATKAGEILLADNTVCNSLGLPPSPAVDVSPSATLVSFLASWFSTSRSTEAMKRGTANEGAVFAALSVMSFVIAVYECGMLAKNHADWMACSPDGVALIDAKELGFEEGGEPAVHMLATVEIKTSIAQSSLDRVLGRATVDVIKCTVGDATFREYVPIQHTGQLLHQMLVLSVNYAVYVSAAEVGIIYIVIVKCSNETLSVCRAALRNKADAAVSCAHKDDPAPPQFASRESRRSISDNLCFWFIVNAYVKEHGAFPPLKLFKHGTQSLYSKTKGGVDGSTQARSILRSSTSSFSWEQKVVSQTFKTLSVNSFIAWRMSGKEQLLQSMEEFGSLDHYRDVLNRVQSFADFVLDVSRQLLVHADQFALASARGLGDDACDEPVVVRDVEIARLRALAQRRRNKRLMFFNSLDGTKLRLEVRSYQQRQLPGNPKCCCLFGSAAPRRRTTFKCTTCDVNLCVRTLHGQRKSCWGIWHEAKRLASPDTRGTQRTAPVTERRTRPGVSPRDPRIFTALRRSLLPELSNQTLMATETRTAENGTNRSLHGPVTAEGETVVAVGPTLLQGQMRPEQSESFEEARVRPIQLRRTAVENAADNASEQGTGGRRQNSEIRRHEPRKRRRADAEGDREPFARPRTRQQTNNTQVRTPAVHPPPRASFKRLGG